MYPCAGEESPLDPTEYAEVLAEIDAAVAAHEAALFVAPIAGGANAPEYCLCCDPNSQERYPDHPRCTCNPENW